MTNQEQITADQYRFSGYQLELLILDGTGPSYAIAKPHPYYYNQPAYWQKNAYSGNAFYYAKTIGGDIAMEPAGNSTQLVSTTSSGIDVYKPTMFQMLSF